MGRTEKICQSCGVTYTGSKYSHYCSACTKKIKSNVMATRICKDCGSAFLGGPRASRCPVCREIAKKNKIKKPTMRPLGSTDKCERCGKEYIVEGGRQKYCPDCQRDASLEWQRKHKIGYAKKAEVKNKKQEKRDNQMKVCRYCQRPFRTDSSTIYCSEYCRNEQKKYNQAIFDVKRGISRNLEKYETMREMYRKKCKSPR